MKKNLITILLMTIMLCACTCTNTENNKENKITHVSKSDVGKDNYICMFHDQERKFMLHLPDDYGENTPLLFMLHGYANNPESFALSTGMNKTADERGYVVVYPQGIADPSDVTSAAGWNSGIKDEGNDDVGFLVALADYLQKEYGLNKEATFAAGFSNGAFMMYRLACEAPDTFKGVASVAGFMPEKIWNEKKEKASVGILQINGTKDDVVPLKDSENSAYESRPTINQVIDYWKQANNLAQETEEILSDKATSTCYYSDSNPNLVCYIEIEGGSHSWPEESFAGFKTNEVILDFFDKLQNN